MNKKKIFTLALVAIMLAILSFSTLAWFSDADSVTNEFMIANSEEKPDKIFSVELFEKVDDNGDHHDYTDKGKVYKDILPGDDLYKEPIVKNTGSYDQYIRVKVTATDAKAWAEMLRKYKINDLATIFEGFNEDLWERVDEPAWDRKHNTVTYVFYLEQPLEPGKTVSLFTNVVIPFQLTQNDLAEVDGSFQLHIVAEAVQTENVGDNAVEAFATVEASGQPIDQIKK